MPPSPTPCSSYPTAVSDSVDALGELRMAVAAFRIDYHSALRDATGVVDHDWDLTWAHAVDRALTELRTPDSDVSAIRFRLRHLLERWRADLLDPVRMHCRSLYIQETVARHVARIEMWCDDHRPAGSQGNMDDDADCTSSAFRAMLANPGEFDGYRIADALNHDSTQFHFGAPVGLYGVDGTSAYLDAVARRALCCAALGEMLRCERDLVYAAHVGAAPGRFVTPEHVAIRLLGYPAPEESPSDARSLAYAEWRRPIAEAEETLLNTALTPCPAVSHALARWLVVAQGCAPARYLGVRFPPCFSALLADVLVECLMTTSPERLAWCDPRILDAAISAGRSRTHFYPRWLLHGHASLDPPSADELMCGWDALDRAALYENGGAFTAAFRVHWHAARSAAHRGWRRAACNHPARSTSPRSKSVPTAVAVD